MRIVTIGHRRSGCHFFMESIKKNYEVREIIKSHHLVEGQREIVEGIYQHRLPQTDDKKFAIVRDGRDTLTSSYFWHLNSGEWKSEWSWRKRDQDWNDISGWLRSDVFMHQNLLPGTAGSPIEYWKFWVEGWLSTGLPWFRYEDLWEDPVNTLRAIGMELELKPKVGADFNKVDHLVGFMPRRGIIGDWRNHWFSDDIEMFWAICEELMDRLGYT